MIINSSTQRPCKKITISDIEEFAEIAIERLDELLLSFTEEEGLIILVSDVDLEDFCDLPDGCNKLYHPRGAQIYEDMQRRLYSLGRHYFGAEIDDMDLKSIYISD